MRASVLGRYRVRKSFLGRYATVGLLICETLDVQWEI